VGHSRLDKPGSVAVRFNRKKGVAFGLLLTTLIGPASVHALWIGNVGVALLLSPLVLMGLACLMGAIRARPELLIDSTGLTFCRANAHVDWSEIAAVEIQEWQGNYDLLHRLVLRAVHPQRFDEMWRKVPRRPWITRPRDGRIRWPLDLLSPSAQRIADAIRESSDGRFAPEVRRVTRQPFRDPESI
jgi:hypothetical protein